MNIYHDSRGRFCSRFASAALKKMGTEDRKSYIKAVSEEPAITNELTNAGAHLIGLSRRIKSPQSTLEKIERENKSVRELYDIVRYTHIGDADNLIGEMKHILGALKEKAMAGSDSQSFSIPGLHRWLIILTFTVLFQAEESPKTSSADSHSKNHLTSTFFLSRKCFRRCTDMPFLKG